MKNSIFQIKLVSIIIGVVLTTSLFAQNPYQKEPLAKRFFVEGIVGLQFGTITAIEVSPLVGFKVTNNFITGLGFTYQYSDYQDFYLNLETGDLADREINTIGSRFFTRYYFADWFEGLLGGLFVHGEYEYLSYSRNFREDRNGKYVDVYGIPYSAGNQKVSVPGLLVGGGLQQSIGGSAYASILVLYNLNETNDTPYSNPIFRIGIGFGM
ncbi:MAG: hypothetical protein IH598_16045 [Bacteroidales bacterium]|nr:hypothetical protein [Bacteroidales bacterium]